MTTADLIEGAAETPMHEHVAHFWHLLETEQHVRILLDMRRTSLTGPSWWDSSSFSNDVAKAILADYQALQARHELALCVLERARTILGNMAMENVGLLNFVRRWPISHEPLRTDAKNLLPEIGRVLKAALQAVKVPARSQSLPKETR